MEQEKTSKPLEPSLRPATAFDLPPIWCLLDDWKHTFLEDSDTLDRQFIADLVKNGEIIVCHTGGLPWGVFWVSDIQPSVKGNDNLHGTLHFLCEPSRLRDVVKHDLIAKFIDRAFVVYNIRKLKGRALEPQTTAIKLLVKHRFFRVGKLINETSLGGKPTTVVLFELQRHYWQKNRGFDNATRFGKHPNVRTGERRIERRRPSTRDREGAVTAAASG